nr:MAG: hypothetical protein EDM05_28395 [Leptolyngbya sp. IPPAS B-1204]
MRGEGVDYKALGLVNKIAWRLGIPGKAATCLKPRRSSVMLIIIYFPAFFIAAESLSFQLFPDCCIPLKLSIFARETKICVEPFNTRLMQCQPRSIIVIATVEVNMYDDIASLYHLRPGTTLLLALSLAYLATMPLQSIG